MIKGIFKKEIKDNDFYLKLEDDNECVDVVVVDRRGLPVDMGYLLEINKKTGNVTFHDGINEDLGLELNASGRLIESYCDD